MCVCVFVYVCVGEYAHPRFFPCLSDGSKSYNIVAFSYFCSSDSVQLSTKNDFYVGRCVHCWY